MLMSQKNQGDLKRMPRITKEIMDISEVPDQYREKGADEREFFRVCPDAKEYE
jgi:hypothetical protein